MSKLEDICIKALEIKNPVDRINKLYQCNYHKGFCLKPKNYRQCHHKIMLDYMERLGEVYKGE